MVIAALISAALLSQTDPIGDNRKLVWKDEFNGRGAVDSANWGFELGHIRNQEEQEYVDDIRNVQVKGGNLWLTADRENGMTRSGSIESHQSWRYGYFEVRAQFPTGLGTWPAIWFLGQSSRLPGQDHIGWPGCGEIDLMENVGFEPDSVHFTVHTADLAGKGHESKGFSITRTTPWKSFHRYGLDWTHEHLDFYFDGEKVFRYANDGKNPWPFDAPEYIKLNLAIGGAWGGQKGVDPAIFPSIFKVDYVRVYQ